MDAFGELSYDPLKLNSGDFCFVNGINEKPCVIDLLPPVGKFAPRVHRQGTIESVAPHVFDTRVENISIGKRHYPGSFCKLSTLSTTRLGEDDSAPFCEQFWPADSAIV